MLLLRVSSKFPSENERKRIRSSRFAQLVWSLVAAACTTPHYQDSQPGDAQSLEDQLASDAGSSSDVLLKQDATTSEASSKLPSDAGSIDRGSDAAAAAPLSDAALPGQAADAETAPPQQTMFPSWATPLLGTYAVQAHSFSSDNYANILKSISRLEEISLVHIERVGQTAEMRSKLCSYLAEGENDELRMTDPSGLPELRRTLSFGEDKSWTTDAAPWGIGYSRDVPAECVGKENEQVAKRPGQQAWLTGSTCRCPSTAQASPTAEDCRVTDPDNDNKPGLTFAMKGRGALVAVLNEVFQAVLIDRSHIVGGRVDESGTNHYGNRVLDGVAYQFPCTTSNCSLVSDVARPCTSEHNGMRFHRLEQQSGDPEWNCAKILENIAKLFPTPLPAAPTTCSQQVLTDDPNRR